MSLPREGRHQVPQLVRVSNDIDRRDLAVANVERGGLQDAAIDADIAGQAVDFGGAQQLRRGRVLAAQPGEQTESAIESSEEHTSELQPLMRTSYGVSCMKKQLK